MDRIILPLLVIAGGSSVWSNQEAVEILRSPTKVVVLKPDPIPVVKFHNMTNPSSETGEATLNNFVNETSFPETRMLTESNAANETIVKNETTVSNETTVPIQAIISNETNATNETKLSNVTVAKDVSPTYSDRLNELLTNFTSDEIVDVIVTGNDDGSVTVQEVGVEYSNSTTFNNTEDPHLSPITPPCIRRDYEDSAAAIFMKDVGPIETAYLIFNSSIPYSADNMLNVTDVTHLKLLNETTVDCDTYFGGTTNTRKLSSLALASLAG